jgi:midasin
MADRNKFEEMLERLINEDKEGAEELFHEIVVEKSRDIYEGLLENDLEEVADEEVDEATDEEVDEATDEEVDEATDEEVEEGFDLDEFEVEADDDMGGDPTDDMMADLGMDDEEGDEDEGEEGDMEDRVEDLEDALEDLKAEFEKMMAGDDEGDDEGEEEPEEEAFAYEATDEEVDEATDEEVEESDEEVEEATDEEVEESKAPQTAGEQMREYVEKVTATMGDNGANTKSAVASANDMGGDAGNIAQGADEKGRKADSAKEDSAGNVNVPGGKASKSMKSQPGHGAEKKGKPETADNKKPTIGG